MDPDKRENSDAAGDTPPHCEHCAMHGARCVDPQLVTTGIDMGMALVGCASFECVFAVTGSVGVVLAQTGPYTTLSEPGEAFPLLPGQITVRLRPESLHASILERTDGDFRELMVEFSAFGGHPVHLVRVASDFDNLIMDGLLRSASEGLTQERKSLPQVFIPWEEGDQLGQIDAILDDGGETRRELLPHYYGGPRPRWINQRVLPAVFEHLCTTALPLSVVVFAEGVAQAVTGFVHVASADANGRMSIGLGSASLDLELSLVHEALLVQSHGPLGLTSAIELYDDRHHVLALLTQIGSVSPEVHRSWELLAESLPDAQ
ncbi:MAG: hypothetical protein QM705_10820 [Ancrocorticia sp.]